MIGCAIEGGEIGIKFNGDILGFTCIGLYAEAQKKLFDFSECGFVNFDIRGGYYNHVDQLFIDGGSQTGGPIISGVFDETNRIVNVGGVINSYTYRGRMELSARANLAEYRLQSNNDGILSFPANWITNKNTNISFCSTFLATSLSDYRQKATLIGDTIIAPHRSGDPGATYTGFVPFTTQSAAGLIATIDTRIVYRPNSGFVAFSFSVSDGTGLHEVAGIIFGTTVIKLSADPLTPVASNNGGFLRLTMTVATAPLGAVTGSIQLLG
jgi:hypothetical protein